MIPKKSYSILFIILFYNVLASFAQAPANTKVLFFYDAAGNRIARQLDNIGLPQIKKDSTDKNIVSSSSASQVLGQNPSNNIPDSDPDIIQDKNNLLKSDSDVTGISDSDTISQVEALFDIAPNPTFTSFTLYQKETSAEVIRNIVLYNIHGEVLEQFYNTRAPLTINIGNYDAGIYYLKISLTGGLQTIKILKN